MPLTRRELLKGMGLVAGGLSLSAAGYEHLVPFIHQPDDLVPGASTWYATTCRECPAGCGMLTRSREDRIVKCEGNPLHPVGVGRLCARGQAALDGLYDPDRIYGPRFKRDRRLLASSWDDAIAFLGPVLAASAGRIACITDLQTGSLSALFTKWMAGLGGGRTVVYEPIDYSPIKAATGGVVPWFDISGSDFLISFAADFLETWISPVEYAWQFSAMRQIKGSTRGRFVYVGPRVSATAASADLRIIVPPGSEAAVAYAIASEAGIAGTPAGFGADEVARRLKIDAADIKAAARGLAAARTPLALPGGDVNSARAAMSLNRTTGLVDVQRPHALTFTSPAGDMASLIEDMEAGRVDVLVVHQANPVYSLPDSARFVEALKKVKTVISLSTFMDEMTARADWVLPSNHSLESWGDYQPYPDVASLMQPTMAARFNTRHAGDILIALASRAGAAVPGATSFLDFLRRRWGAPPELGALITDPAPVWEAAVAQGGRWTAPPVSGGPAPMVGLTTTPPRTTPGALPSGPPSPPVSAKPSAPAPWAALSPDDVLPANDKEIRLHAFPHIFFYDGRGANRRLLQETPEPMTKAVWSSWVEMHPSTADRLGVPYDLGYFRDTGRTSGLSQSVVTVSVDGRKVEMPVFVWEGIAPGTVAVPIGQGHSEYGRFAKAVGSNVYPLMAKPGSVVMVAKTGGSQIPSAVRGSTDEQDRKLALVTDLRKPAVREKITMPTPEGYGQEDFYPGHKHLTHRWAMVVDLSKCTGCNACSTACYVENNIGIVGARDVRWGREMAWLRIDRYVDWKHKSAPVLFEPMLCQHCDSAPCESVCPVFAASHSEDGINMQVYNRCIGTRYCANNCPYKVRRFNWYHYDWPEPMNWRLNPDVTVRDRGVMEKCTFCVQRIREAEIIARKQGREPKDGEVVTACQQTCPTGVYTFGDLMDPDSAVSKIVKSDPRAFQVLPHLNTKPAVIYLKRVVEDI